VHPQLPTPPHRCWPLRKPLAPRTVCLNLLLEVALGLFVVSPPPSLPPAADSAEGMWYVVCDEGGCRTDCHIIQRLGRPIYAAYFSSRSFLGKLVSHGELAPSLSSPRWPYAQPSFVQLTS